MLHLKVFLILGLLFFTSKAVGREVPKLAWGSASMGGCHSSTLTASSTVVPVPISYNPDEGEMKLFVKRYMSKGATTAGTHLIMLPGGPGQDQTILESHIEHIERFVGSGTIAFYLPDLRCVGQSGSFVMPGDYNWAFNSDAVAQKSPIPLQAITLSNSAGDILLLAKAIRASSEFVSGAQMNLFGVSFGATWAYRTLQLDKDNLFNATILDSLAPLEGLVAPENDEGLLRNCNDHPYCKAQFGGDAKNARTMLEDVLNPACNECSAQLAKAFTDPGSFHPTFSPLFKFYILVQPALEGAKDMGKRLHASQLVLAFLKATRVCSDPVGYAKILSFMLAEASLGGSSARPKTTAPHNTIAARASGGGEMNMVVNYIFFISEAYDIPNGGNAKCGPITLSHQCVLFSHYRSLYEMIKKYVSPRDTRATAPFSTSARVYLVHGEVDMLTPVVPAMRFAGNIQGSVRKFVYRNWGHSLISDGECAAFIWKEAFGGGSSKDTDKCLEAVNSVPLDWTFKNQPEYQTWWDQQVPVTYIADPAIPSASSGISLWILILIAVLVILVIGAGAGIYFKMRPTPASAST